MDAITLDPKIAGPLLVANPNLKPGKPLEIRLPFATLRLGVWGHKRRYPFPLRSNASRVEPLPQTLEALELLTQRIRDLAADMKAVLAYMVEGARATGLEFLEGLARLEVREVRQWDRPTTKDIMERHKRERPTVQEILDRDPGENLPPGALFPVDERWALVWEDVEENAETARRLQDSWRRFGDPTLRLVDSVPVSWESYVRHRDNMTPSFLDYLKDLSSDRS